MGAFGEVHKVRTDKGHLLAAKTIKVSVEVGDAVTENAITKEVKEAQILCSLRHPNIVKFVKVVQHGPGKVCVFTELIEGRSLSRLLNKQPLDEKKIQHYCTQVSGVLTLQCWMLQFHSHASQPLLHFQHEAAMNSCILCICLADLQCPAVPALPQAPSCAQRHQGQKHDDRFM